MIAYLPRNFNPRPREEGDVIPASWRGYTRQISIHALVKRATSVCGKQLAFSDISIHALVKRATVFQSTPS